MKRKRIMSQMKEQDKSPEKQPNEEISNYLEEFRIIIVKIIQDLRKKNGKDAMKRRTWLSDFTFMHWRRTWQPTPMFLPGESQGWGSLVGCHLWVTQSRTRLKRLSSSSRRTKEQTEMNSTLEGMNNWGRRMDKWPGGQNGGNQCHKTEYRKNNEKKINTA